MARLFGERVARRRVRRLQPPTGKERFVEMFIELREPRFHVELSGGPLVDAALGRVADCGDDALLAPDSRISLATLLHSKPTLTAPLDGALGGFAAIAPYGAA